MLEEPYKPLPPGNYTRENLPPPHPSVQKIINEVDELAAHMSEMHPIRPGSAEPRKQKIVFTGPTKKRV